MALTGFKYSKFTFVSADMQKSIDILNSSGRISVSNFSYYENILSPHITGSALITSSSEVVSSNDRQQRFESLSSGLPLSVGSQLLVKITTDSSNSEPLLDFSSAINPYKQLYITNITQVSKDSTKEVIAIRFASRTAHLNETTRVTRRYTSKITDSVKTILQKELEIDDEYITIDDSSNSYSFIGMNRRPLDIIINLCNKTIPPQQTNPGYFCFETKSGFKYISADKIINSAPFPKKYKFNGQNVSTFELKNTSNLYKLASFSNLKDQDLLSQIRSGVYATKNCFFNPATNGFTEIDISVIDNNKFSSLAQRPETPNIIQERNKKYHRVQSCIFDCGAESNSPEINNSPELYYAATSARYNILFSQIYSATIMGNSLLEAGNVLDIEMESSSNKKEQGPDERRSGRYIIHALRHYFDNGIFTTHLKLIRDSYGLHFTRND